MPPIQDPGPLSVVVSAACVTCKEQPDYFEKIVNWQMSHVTHRGKLITAKGGDMGYQCPTGGGTAEWGSELNDRD